MIMIVTLFKQYDDGDLAKQVRQRVDELLKSKVNSYHITPSQSPLAEVRLHKQATIHQVTTMLATSKNVLFPGHKYLLTTGANHWTLYLNGAWAIIKGLGHQYWLIAGGYDLEIGHFRSV